MRIPKALILTILFLSIYAKAFAAEPSAIDVYISGTTTVGQVLTGNYTYVGKPSKK